MICEKFYFLSAENETNDKKNYGLVTHAYGHRLADVHLAAFAPAFPLSFHDSERSRKPPNAHSLGRYQTCKEKKESLNMNWHNSHDKTATQQVSWRKK